MQAMTIKTDSQDVVAQEMPLTEPEIIRCLMVNGTAIEADACVVRLTSWVQVNDADMRERRIISRIAMSSTEARRLAAALRTALARGGH
jgi:hypothetical protein